MARNGVRSMKGGLVDLSLAGRLLPSNACKFALRTASDVYTDGYARQLDSYIPAKTASGVRLLIKLNRSIRIPCRVVGVGIEFIQSVVEVDQEGASL
jgi:hypothetical protein